MCCCKARTVVRSFSTSFHALEDITATANHYLTMSTFPRPEGWSWLAIRQSRTELPYVAVPKC